MKSSLFRTNVSVHWKYVEQNHKDAANTPFILQGINAVVQRRNNSCVWLFLTPWTAACQAPLFSAISRSLLKFTSIESVMLFNHLILCCPRFLLPSIFPSVRVFSNESAFCIRWPKYKEFQHQDQSFQWIFRVDFLWDWRVWSPSSPKDSQVFSNTMQTQPPNTQTFSWPIRKKKIRTLKTGPSGGSAQAIHRNPA